MVAQNNPGRKFVPIDLNPDDWSQIDPLCKQLLDAPINSAAELETWLSRASEFSAALDEYGARLYVDKSCHTDDTEIEKKFMHFVENIEPKLKPLFFEMQKKYLESPYRSELKDRRYTILTRKWQADVDVFRPENVDLETQVTKIVTEYDKTCGAMLVDYRGKTYTMQQLARFGEETDRAVRQETFELANARRMQDKDKIEKQFEQLLPLRDSIAENAGFKDFREYTWKSLKRFDYTPDDCHKFADAIEKSIVPLVRELDRQRKADLGVDVLRPWDMAVDPKNRQPLRPFADDEIDTFVSKTKQIFQRMSPTLADEFETLRTNGNLDLDSRKHKQPGGYQCSYEEAKQPFIFMNAAGLQRDVETLLHEGGHAFHFIAASTNEPLVYLRSAPMEFCEVASMSMEALAADHYDIFYKDPAEASRAKRAYLEGIIRFFPWMATIDQYQHWIYTHPGHKREERNDAWLKILNRFAGLADWTGYEEIRACSWQRQLHLYHVPFYYIEYGIAQIGALQMWMKAKEDTQRAIANYRSALKLGGTRPLPELFAAAGLNFDFSTKTIDPLIRAVGEELASLPA